MLDTMWHPGSSVGKKTRAVSESHHLWTSRFTEDKEKRPSKNPEVERVGPLEELAEGQQG